MVTPDRSLVFTSMDYFMSTVRKAAALHPKIPVVIDLSYVSIADFTTAYVRVFLFNYTYSDKNVPSSFRVLTI